MFLRGQLPASSQRGSSQLPRCRNRVERANIRDSADRNNRPVPHGARSRGARVHRAM